MKQKLKNVSKKFQLQKNEIKYAQKLSKSKIFLEHVENLPDSIKIFSNMQLKIKNKPRGRRFTNEEKIMALSIFKQSPKAYNFLKNIFVLPSKRCVQKQLSLIEIKPGINSEIFNNIKKSARRLSEEKKLCTLIFDEVAVEAGLYFNRARIVGFEDFGYKQTNMIADHALVFMIKSIKGKYKQPICFTFCRSCTKKEDLKKIIIDIIREIHKTGLTIVATICDQSQTNISVVNSLKEDTKRIYLRQGIEHNCLYFEVDHKPVFPMFDTPHLLKGVRNNLLKKDAKYIEENLTKIASWEHIKMLYNEDVGEQELKLVNKLTEFHVMETKIPKMKVKHAAQVFSQRVASALNFLSSK